MGNKYLQERSTTPPIVRIPEEIFISKSQIDVCQIFLSVILMHNSIFILEPETALEW